MRVDVRFFGDQRRGDDHAIAGCLEMQPAIEQLFLQRGRVRPGRRQGGRRPRSSIP